MSNDGAATGDALSNDGAATGKPSWKTLPTFTTNRLRTVWGTAADNAWAAGDGGVLFHYNGNQWSAVHSGTSNSIRALWGSSATDIWGVGTTSISTPMIIRYNGKKWYVAASPNALVPTIYSAVWGTGADNVWAIGLTYVNHSWQHTAVVHFNGTFWETAATLPSRLAGLWGSGPDDIRAVGAASYHYDGKSWGKAPEPFFGSSQQLWGTAAEGGLCSIAGSCQLLDERSSDATCRHGQLRGSLQTHPPKEPTVGSAPSPRHLPQPSLFAPTCWSSKRY
ncbi:MAG: hypothetical protein JRH20_08245 [Deltaproteobacteria bacterium]|nr:hypothetical protein [Deltaproteobacteria bacterium]